MALSTLRLNLGDTTGPGRVGEILIRPLSSSNDTAIWTSTKAARLPLKYSDPDHAPSDPAYSPEYTLLDGTKYPEVTQGAQYEFTVVRVNNTKDGTVFTAVIPASASVDFDDLTPTVPIPPSPATAYSTSQVDTFLSGKQDKSTLAADMATINELRGASNAKSHGVRGDGNAGTSQTAAETTALNAWLASLAPGSVGYLPPGEYVVDKVVMNNLSGFRLYSEGAIITCKTISDRYVSLVNCSNFVVKGITSRGYNVTTRQGPTRAFSMEGCSNFLLAENIAGPCEGVGIYSNACSDYRILNNRVTLTKADGIHNTNGCKNFVISGNTLNDTGDDALAVVSYQTDSAICENFSITGNSTIYSRSRGVAVVGGRNGSVVGNTITETRNAGIYISYESSYNTYGVAGLAVTANTIRKANTFASPSITYAAIHAVGDGSTTWPLSGITLANNVIEDPAYIGILAGSSGAGCYDFNVHGNQIRNGGSHGILAQSVTGLNMHGNSVDTVSGYGMWLSGTLGIISYIGNSVKNPNTGAAGGYGHRLNVTSATQAVATGNVFSDSGVNTSTRFSKTTNVTAYGNDGESVGALAQGLGREAGGVLYNGIPNAQFAGQSSRALVPNRLSYYPIDIRTPITVNKLLFEVTVAPASSANVRLGLYAADKDWQPTGAPLTDQTVAVAAAFTGAKATTISLVLPAGRYVMAQNCDVAMTVRTIRGGVTFIPSAMGAASMTEYMYATETYGAFASPGTKWTTAAASSTGGAHMAMLGWVDA